MEAREQILAERLEKPESEAFSLVLDPHDHSDLYISILYQSLEALGILTLEGENVLPLGPDNILTTLWPENVLSRTSSKA